MAADLLSLLGKSYTTLVDYYSDFVGVSELPDTTASTVFCFLREQSSRHDIPDIGSQIVSQEFIKFATDWGFKRVSFYPCYPRSNGKAKSPIKVVKNVFSDNKDSWLALLDYQNTLSDGLKSSPVQRLMSRRTRKVLPTATSLLMPKVIEAVEERLKGEINS